MDAKKQIKKYTTGKTMLVFQIIFGIMVGSILLGLLNPGFFALTAISFVVLFFDLIAVVSVMPYSSKCLKRLEQTGMLEKAAAELAAGNGKIIGKNKGILTENFIFGRKGVVVAYSDVLWTYKHKMTRTFLFIPIMVTESLVVNTPKFKGLYAISIGRDKKEELKEAMVEIFRHNPQVLVGYSKENEKAYKSLSSQRV